MIYKILTYECIAEFVTFSNGSAGLWVGLTRRRPNEDILFILNLKIWLRDSYKLLYDIIGRNESFFWNLLDSKCIFSFCSKKILNNDKIFEKFEAKFFWHIKKNLPWSVFYRYFSTNQDISKPVPPKNTIISHLRTELSMFSCGIDFMIC